MGALVARGQITIVDLHDGVSYTLNINGGVRGIAYAADGSNPDPTTNTATDYTAEVLKNGVKVEPYSYVWTTGGCLSGSGTRATFRPIINTSYVSGNTFVTVKIKETRTSDEMSYTIPVVCTKHADGLDWIGDWNGTVVDIKGNRVVTPKLFAGKNTGTSMNPNLTGVAVGLNVLDGNDKTTGIVGYKNNDPRFKLDTEGNFFVGSGWGAIESGSGGGLKYDADKKQLNISGNVKMTTGSTIGNKSAEELLQDVAGKASIHDMNTRFELTDGKISAGVNESKAYADTKDGVIKEEVRVLGSDLTIAKNQISLKVEQTDIDKTVSNVVIGGRNLVPKSDTMQGLFTHLDPYKGIRTEVKDPDAKSGKHLEFKCTSDGVGFYMQIFPRTSDRIGKQFTWSFWGKCTVVRSVTTGHEGGGIKDISMKTNWEKFTHTWTMNSEGSQAFIFYTGWKVGEILYIRDFKIEEGNKATDWIPAPEDTDKAIADAITVTEEKIKTAKAEIKIETDRINLEVGKTNSVVTSHTSSINAVDGKINTAKGQAVTESVGVKDRRSNNDNPQYYFTTYPKRTVEEFKFATTIGIPNAIANKYGVCTTIVPWTDSSGGYPTQTFRSDITPTFERKATSTTAWGSWVQIEDTAGSQNKATQALNTSKTYTETKVSEAQASIKLTTDSIKQSVSSVDTKVNTVTVTANNALGKIDGLQVGGANLFQKSGNFGTTVDSGYWVNNGGGLTVDTANQYNGYNTIKTTVGAGISGIWYTLENNVEYTYSAMVKCDTVFNVDGGYPLHYHVGKSNTNQGKIEIVSRSGNYTEVNKWQRIYITFKLTQDADSFRPFVYFGPSKSLTMYIANLQLERGNKVTDWSPSTKDTQGQIDSHTAQISNTNTKVATIETNLSSITQRVSSTENTTKTINDKVVSVDNRLKTAENKITDNAIISTVSSTINAAKTEAINSANGNTANQLKNYSTTSSMNSAIQQKADSILSTVSNTYTDKNTTHSMQSQINQQANQISTKVDAGYVNSQVTQSVDQVKFDFSGVTGRNSFTTVQSGGVYPNGSCNLEPFPHGHSAHHGGGKAYRWYGESSALRTRFSNAISGNGTYSVSFWAKSLVGNYPTLSIDLCDVSHWDAFGVKTEWRLCKFENIQISNYSWEVFNFLDINCNYSESLWWDILISNIMINEGPVCLEWTEPGNEVIKGNTIINAGGVTINNGALRVKNNAGQEVISADSAGNLIIGNNVTIRGRLQPDDYNLHLFSEAGKCIIGGGYGALRLQYNSQNYVSIDDSYTRFWNRYSENGAKYMSIGLDWEKHGNIIGGNTLIKLLGHGTATVQSRWSADTGYANFAGSGYITSSRAEYKENIHEQDYINFIDVLKNNAIKGYNYKLEVEACMGKSVKSTRDGSYIPMEADVKTGLILEDLTEDAMKLLHPQDSDGIELYAMSSVLWKVCQEQQLTIENLETEIKTIKKHLGIA